MEGKATQLFLQLTPRSMAMDGPEAKTSIRLTSKATNATLFEKSLEGECRLLSFSQATTAYVIGVTSTMGTWRGVVAVLYLDERAASGAHLRDAKGPGEKFFALSAVASVDGDMIAFVSQTRSPATTGGFRLQLLDVARDRLRDLGAPPAPPPLDPELQSECKAGRARGWADPNVGGMYEDMDANIITFADGKLRASYGADTCKARAKKRTVKEWSLTP